MQPIKMTLTALVIGTSLVGSAFAIDTTGKADHTNSPASTTNGLDQQNTLQTTPTAPYANSDNGNGPTANSGETPTDKTQLILRGEKNAEQKH